MRTTLQEKEAVIKMIEEKAIAVFSSKGYKNTSMGDIAAAANISRGPLYYHFKSKPKLFEHVANLYINRIYKQYNKIWNGNDAIFKKIHDDMICCVAAPSIIFFRDIKAHTEMAKLGERFNYYDKWLYNIKVEKIKGAIDQGEIRKDAEALIIVEAMYAFGNGVAVTMVDEKIKSASSLLAEAFADWLRIAYIRE